MAGAQHEASGKALDADGTYVERTRRSEDLLEEAGASESNAEKRPACALNGVPAQPKLKLPPLPGVKLSSSKMAEWEDGLVINHGMDLGPGDPAVLYGLAVTRNQLPHYRDVIDDVRRAMAEQPEASHSEICSRLAKLASPSASVATWLMAITAVTAMKQQGVMIEHPAGIGQPLSPSTLMGSESFPVVPIDVDEQLIADLDTICQTLGDPPAEGLAYERWLMETRAKAAAITTKLQQR